MELRKEKRTTVIIMAICAVMLALCTYTFARYIKNLETSGQVKVKNTYFERVYGDANAPYDQKDGFGKYYVHSTATSWTVDFKDEVVNGKFTLAGTEITDNICCLQKIVELSIYFFRKVIQGK
ncbi:hypothetical protein [Coprobacillus cateniformis]|uniref:hypothetical protein n=1 Tax=Coprobacillus cateniformis TaxID=100884 RepID=UPI0039A2179B